MLPRGGLRFPPVWREFSSGKGSVLEPTSDPFGSGWRSALRHNLPIAINNTNRNFFE